MAAKAKIPKTVKKVPTRVPTAKDVMPPAMLAQMRKKMPAKHGK